MATFGLSGLRLGPDQRTGITPSRFQVTTFSRSPVMAMMVAVCRLTPFAKLEIQAVSLALSLQTGRLSLTLLYLIRVGSCQTNPLFPPSSRCSITTSRPSPSQVLNKPRSSPSMLTVKQTLTAGSSLGGGLFASAISHHSCSFTVQPQFRPQPRGERLIEPASQLIE